MDKKYELRFKIDLSLNVIIVHKKFMKHINYEICLIERKTGRTLGQLIHDYNLLYANGSPDNNNLMYFYIIEMVNEYKQILRNDKIKILLNG